MDDLLTAQLHDVLDRATQEALVLRHQYVGTEHLLLALAERDSEPLAELGVDGVAAIARVHEIVGAGAHPVDAHDLPLTPRAEQVMATAHHAAAADGSVRTGTGHLVRALAGESLGVAGRVLAELRPVGAPDLREPLDAR